MKRTLFTFILLIKTFYLLAQKAEGYGFAIINDKDGYMNVRSQPNVKSHIVGKIKEDELFFCLSNEGHYDWFLIDAKDSLSGYVHRSRLKFIGDFPKFTNIKEIKDTLFIKNGNLTVKIVANHFVKSQHKILKDAHGHVVKIDGKRPWGMDGGLPKVGISSIIAFLNDEIIEIPNDELIDLFQPNFSMTEVYKGQKGNLYITMFNSDGAGGYTVAFAIKDKKYIGRSVFNGF